MNVDLDGDAQLLLLAVLGQCNYSRVCPLALGTCSEAWERHSWNNSLVSDSGAPGPLRGQGLCNSVVRLMIALPVPASQVWDTRLMAGREWLEGHTQLGGKVWLDYFPLVAASSTSCLSRGAARKWAEQAPVACVFRDLESSEQSASAHPHPFKIPSVVCRGAQEGA